MIELRWDDQALSLFENFQRSEPYVKMFMQSLYYKLGKESIQFIKDNNLTKAKAIWNGSTHGTGVLENSLVFNVTTECDGFTINFEGLFYGNYMDVGNFPSGSTITRPGGKGFPVGLRGNGNINEVTWSNTIHGMGYRTPDVPTHFSEKTVNYLAERMHDLVDQYMQELLERLVGR